MPDPGAFGSADNLSADSIPVSDSPWWPTISGFCLTYDGYEAWGGFGPLADYANDAGANWVKLKMLPNTIDDIRACLFFEQRRFRHFGDEPQGEDRQYIMALLARLRTLATGA